MYEKINDLTKKSLKAMDGKVSANFKLVFAVLFLMFSQGAITFYMSVAHGLELWGINNKAVWGVTIANFVFWIGLAHSGTLISAVLYLFKQNWRSSINRAAEAMTLIAIICSGLFLLIHTGRPWLAWLWIIPYPNQFDLWLNFKSPLFWDFIAIFTYFVVSIIFWYVGLIPDLAYYKTKTTSKLKRWLFSFFSIGWRGSRNQWASYLKLYGIIAGIATALVVSVHSVVSMDFALTALPGWHSTIFPPYFVAGAIFSGSAMLVILLNILRYTFDCVDIVTIDHIEKLNKLIYMVSWIVFFSYIIEIFGAMFNDDIYETQLLAIKMKSPIFWMMVVFNCVLPHLYMLKMLRRSIAVSSIISFLIIVGMWLERFMIVVYSQKNSLLLPESIRYTPSVIEMSLFVGSIGLFGVLYMIFLKFVPIIPTWEVANDEKQLRNNLPRE